MSEAKPNSTVANRVISVIGSLVLVLVWVELSFRLSVALILPALALIRLVFPGSRFVLSSVVLWTIFWILTILPCDVTIGGDFRFLSRPGGPHLVPVLYGLSAHPAIEKYKHSGAVLGGCAPPLNAPLWVFRL